MATPAERRIEETEGEPRLISFAFVMAVIAVHFFFVSYAMSIVQVPLALEGEPAWVVGLVVGTLGFAGMITRPLTGVWVDAGRRQLWLRLGAIGTAAAFVGYALDLGPWTTMLFRALHGVGMGFFTTALLAIVGSLLPSHRRGLGMGIYQSFNGAAWLYGSALAVWVIAGFSFEASFLISAGAALLALTFGGAIGDPNSPERERAKSGGDGPLVRQWISRTALLPALVFLSVTTPWGVLNAFLPLFADERGLGNPGVYYSVHAMAQLASRSVAGWASDRFGRGAVIAPALLLATTGLALLAMAQTPGMMIVAALFYGTGIACTQTSVVALIVDRTPPSGLGSGMATYTLAWDVGGVIGSIGLGVLAGLTSYGTVFAVAAVFPLLGLALFFTRVRSAAAEAHRARQTGA